MTLSSTFLHSDSGSLGILPLGGCGEFGMNCTIFYYKDTYIMVDCGVTFADAHLLGVDALFPNFWAIPELMEKLTHIVITHGHEDHIGALPYVLKKNNLPVFATPWTKSLIERKFLSHNMDKNNFNITEVNPGGDVKVGDFSIHYFPVNHSIPDACSLLIKSDKHSVFHSGDFKIEKTPIYEKKVDLRKLKSLADNGVDLMLADSTNAHKSARSGEEGSLVEPFTNLFNKHKGRVIVTTFSSNLWRILTLLKACKKSDRHLGLVGKSLQLNFETGVKHGYISNDDLKYLVPVDELNAVDDDKIVIVSSGCQAEYRSGLARYASGESRLFYPKENDTVIFSSRPIPGNEKAIYRIMDRLLSQGITVHPPFGANPYHVSGHGHGDELNDLFKALRPKHFLPVHGGFFQQDSNKNVSLTSLKDVNVVIPTNGDILKLKGNELTVEQSIDTEFLFVDSFNPNPMSRDVMRARMKIGELGGLFYSAEFTLSESSVQLSHERYEICGFAYPDSVNIDIFNKKLSINLEKHLRNVIFDSSKKEVTEEEIVDYIRIFIRKEYATIINKKVVVVPQIIFKD